MRSESRWGLREDALQVRRGRFHDAVRRVLDHRLQRRYRRAQFMADVGDHVAPRLVGMLEFVSHDVERVGEFAHFVTAVLLDVHAGGIASFGHGLCRVDHLRQGARQMP